MCKCVLSIFRPLAASRRSAHSVMIEIARRFTLRWIASLYNWGGYRERASYNGSTGAFQASNVGSIPTARSNNSGMRRLRRARLAPPRTTRPYRFKSETHYARLIRQKTGLHVPRELGCSRGAMHECRLLRGFGGREGARTPDLLVANEALSQLSYTPIELP